MSVGVRGELVTAREPGVRGLAGEVEVQHRRARRRSGVGEDRRGGSLAAHATTREAGRVGGQARELGSDLGDRERRVSGRGERFANPSSAIWAGRLAARSEDVLVGGRVGLRELDGA